MQVSQTITVKVFPNSSKKKEAVLPLVVKKEIIQ
jgi:hypothetical protein